MMKNLQSSAFVAKTTQLLSSVARLRLLLVMFLTLTVSASAWGATATFTATQSGGWTTTAGAQSGTIDGVTLAVTNGINNGTQLRCYANATMTISSTNNITKIVVTCTSTSNAPSNFSLSNSTGNYSNDGTTGTWEGSATSVSLNASAQVRMTQIVVTYESATPKQDYTLSYQAGENSGTLQVEEGANLLDALGELETPTSCDATSTTFVGWTATEITEKTNTAPMFITSTDVMPSADYAVFAVFAREETTEGGSTTTTFIAGTDDLSIGKNGITFTMSNTTGTSGYYQVFSGSAMSITSDNPITSFSITCTASGTSKYGPGNITFNTGSYSYSGTTGTWTGNSKSIESNNSTAQLRITKIVVTTSGGTTTTYSDYITTCSTKTLVYLHPNGGTISEDSWEITDGEVTYTKTVETTSAVPLPIPTKDGYDFGGWYEHSEFTGSAVTAVPEGTEGEKTYYAKWNCIAPISVTVTPTNENGWRYSIGETISLEATATGGSADAYSYQWQKYIESDWEDIDGATSQVYTKENCGTGDGGTYRCVVSTGDVCSKASEGFWVRVFTLAGNFNSNSEWNDEKIIWSTEDNQPTIGIVTLTLPANETYEFKVADNDGRWFGNPGSINATTDWWGFGVNDNNCTLQTKQAGEYIFTIDVEHAGDPNGAYVNVKVTFPTTQTIYFKPATSGTWADNAKFTIYSWGSGDPSYTPLQDKDCGGIYSAEISTAHTSLLFIKASTYKENFDNITAQTSDLTAPTGDKVLYDMASTNITHLYLKPNDNWKNNSPRNSAYFYGNGEKWVDMEKTKIGDDENFYKVTIQVGYPNVIFCSMNKNTTGNSWDDRWNQTGDLTIPTDGNNLFTLPAGSWDGATTSWSTIYDDSKWTTYTPNHTVSFNANGHGTAPEDQCITDGEKASQPTAPTATGYTFGGWYKEAGCTNAWDFENDVVTSDITLYAKWTANTNTAYTVKHYQENIDGTYPAMPTEIENLTGTTATSVTPDVKDYTGFTAPSTQTVTIAADGSTVVEYKYTRNSYTLTWNLADGEITVAGTTAGSVKFGAPLTAPTVTKSGLTFIGWSPEVPATMPAEDVTYTAIWENCIWVETTTIEDGDEIVFIMVDNEESTSYAMDNKVTSSNPLAIEINTDIFSSGNVPNNIIWDIQKDANGIVFYSKTAAGNYLRCNAKPDVRVGVGANNTFTLDKGYIQSLSNDDSYLAVATGATTKYWRQYGYSSNNITNQTLKFYKRVCLQEGQYWVKWMVNGQEYTVGNPTTMVTDGQITDIPDNPAHNAIGDCADTFMGWSESNLGSAEGQPAPTDLFTTVAEAQSKIGGITENKTFYAVFATASGISDVFSRVTELSQLEDGNTLAIVAEQSGGQIFGTGSDHKGGAAPVESDGKITISVSTNKWILEEVDGGWKLLKDENNKLCADLGYTAYGNTLTIEDSQSDKYFFVRSSNKYLEYYSNAWQFYQIKNTPTSDQNGYVRLKIYKSNVSYSNYVTNCCALAPATNLTVSGTTAKSATLTWTAPSSTTGITKLQVRNAETDAVVVDNIAVNTITTTINGLTECTSYQYYVVSVGDCEVVSNTVTATPFSGAKTVNYDYNGGTGSPASFTTSCDNQKIYLPTPTRPGYTFDGWYDSDENFVGVGGAEYNPTTSPVTLYAHWTETIYKLTHSGSNYTNTENKTSIKSSETPFTLHYTCTGDYGLPATISITGGGKSWTVGTDYTWEVAADRQSATLVIKETVISADVTITINVATRYTVTFVHNDKGVFSGSETLEVLSSENTITLPTVTDLSCGFYDTFEGWIVADEDYTESTSKPAGTIYKGGANYTVNSDCTLRALYSKCEGDATQVYRKVTTTGDVTDGTYILVANTSNPRVYSGYGGSTYGSSVEGLTADGEDFSTTLPVDAKPITVTTGTGTNAGTFTMYNADRSKYLTYTGSSNTLNESDTEVFIWKLTDGSNVDSKSCPAGVLTPNGFDTRVLQCNTSSSYRFACYENNASFPHVFLYKLIDKCTKYYSTNPSCEKPVGVHIVYNANAVDASMSCSTQDRTYKVENEVNKYPQLASQLQFCTNATREGYTLVGWNTQSNGQGTTYNINQNYYNLPVSGELDGDKWITLNLYAMWKPCIKFNLGNATGGTGVPDAVVENGGCVLPTPTAEQLGTIPCGYEFCAWSETSVNATQTKPALFMPGDTYTGSALTLYAVYRLCEVGSNPDLFSLSYTISGTKYYVGPVTRNQEGYAVKFTAITDANNATVFGMKSIEGQTYKSLYWMNEETKEYMYWKDNGGSFTFTSEEDDSYGWTISGTTTLTFLSTAYLTHGSRYLSADATEIGCPQDPKEVTSFTKEMASTTICTYATEPECSTTATLQFVTNGGTLNYPTTYDANSYQNLTPGTTIYLPTATFAGEWTFEGWMKDAPLESQNLKPETVNFIEVDLNITTYSASKTGTTTFYAVYSKTNDDKQFDPVNGGTYKLFAIGADGTKTYMPIWSGGRGTLSGVTTCAETGDYTITPGTGTHAGQYQITCGEHTLGVVGDISQTDLNEVEGTWWNINPSTSGKGTWRITVVGSSNRALSCSFSTAKSFGNYAISEVNSSTQTVYRDMEIGECIYTEYTSTPENIPYITITGAPVKITSTNGERIYAPTTLHIEAHNFTGERIIHLSATNGFGVDPVQVRTNGQGAYSGDVKVYYEPTTDGDGQTITTSVLTASQTGGTNAEKINQTFAAIQGRNMPANFVIAAKWDGLWYALPANCTSSLSSTEGLLIEVNDVENPTMATSAPASAKYGLREVIPSRQTDYGQGIVFTERFAEGDKQFALYNGSNANIQVNAQYTNYAQTNPDKYEWIPSTSDFNEYTLTNASTGRNLGLTSGTFGAYTAASNQVRLLPATFYEPATAQVLKWKANSVIVMYTGAEATATTQVGNNAQSDKQTLADQKLTHGIYELTTDQALTTNAGGKLSLYFGANTRVELEIPLIISGEVTASANAHDVVILENSKLTAAATKYSYKDVYVYGGAKLAIPDGTELGVNNIILRAGGVATNGAGQEATYQYIYPQVELKGTLTSSVQNIRYEYVTDYDHWYHLVLPFDGSLTSIHYPTEYYGDQVKLDNTGSWQIKRYAGEIRATGNYDAWKDIEKDEPKATIVTAGKGYIFWGAPKKITANDEYDRPKWGIQRITMLSDVSATISKAKDAENADKTISGLGSYKNVTNNSGADNDQGWNLIGNPYMVNLTGLNSQSLQIGQLIHETDASGNWTGKWQWDNTSEQTGLRYVTIPSDHFETYEAKPMAWFTEDNPMIAGRSFFVQIAGDATDLVFDVTKKAALVPALLAENNDKPVDIETGIVLSNETLQDEVNFWIKAGKTNDYEYNADYPKTPNNNHFNIYGVHTNGDLSWVATGPEYAAESMPIGYQVPAAGTYILSLTETYDSNYLEALYVTDHEMSPEVTTDLMITSYEFSVNQAETNNKRFTVAIKLKNGDNNDVTGLDNLGIGNEHLMKFIYQDKIYILHHGVIYDATGKRVITINK